MPENFFTAFEGGRNVARKTAAYNALRSAYGDIAGDPETAGQLQRLDQSAQAFPLEQKSRALGNLGAEQTITQSAELQPGRVEAQATTNAQAGQNLEEDKVKAARAAMLNGAMFVQGVIDQKGDYTAALARVAPALGLTPEQVQQINQGITGNPEYIKDFVKALQDPANALAQERLSQGAQRIEQGETALGLAARRVGQGDVRLDPERQGQIAQAKGLGTTVGKGEGEKVVEDLPLSGTGEVKVASVMEGVDQRFDVARKAIASAIDGTSWLNAGPLASLPDFANPAAADLRADLDTILAQVVPDAMAEMRAAAQGVGGSGTGFGQLVNKELDLLKARYGAVLQTTTPLKLKRALADLQTQLDASHGRVAREHQKLQAVRRPAVAPTNEPPDTTGGRVEGQNIILKWNPATGQVE